MFAFIRAISCCYLSLVIYNYLLLFFELADEAETEHYLHEAREIASRYDDTRTLITLDHFAVQKLIDNGEQSHRDRIWLGVMWSRAWAPRSWLNCPAREQAPE